MAFKTTRTLLPGQSGTKRLAKEYGNKLVCVRYKYDEVNHHKIKTVEIIVDEGIWEKRSDIHPNKIVLIRIDYGEINLARLVKNAGGKWNKQKRAWEISYCMVKSLGLENRIKKDLENG